MYRFQIENTLEYIARKPGLNVTKLSGNKCVLSLSYSPDLNDYSNAVDYGKAS